MAEIINRKYQCGKLVSETREEIDWEPNEADLDIVQAKCKSCGMDHQFPWDVMAFGQLSEIHCACGVVGAIELIDE